MEKCFGSMDEIKLTGIFILWNYCEAAELMWFLSRRCTQNGPYSHSLHNYEHFHCVNFDFADAKWNWRSVMMTDLAKNATTRRRSTWSCTTWVGIFWTNCYNRTLDYYYRMDSNCGVLIVVCVSSVSALCVMVWMAETFEGKSKWRNK